MSGRELLLFWLGLFLGSLIWAVPAFVEIDRLETRIELMQETGGTGCTVVTEQVTVCIK